MSEHLPVTLPIRTADLAGRRPRSFDLRPAGEVLAAIAAVVGVSALRKLSFSGTLRPEGRRDVVLDATLGATVVQPCVVTLEPVTTRIDVPVLRRYLADLTEPEGGAEVEIPEDDTAEPLPPMIDPAAVMIEALALALPDYPRAPGAALGEAVFAAPGAAPLRDADLRPFAGLAALRDGLAAAAADPAGEDDEPGR